jgi:chemotaxis protein CheX
MDGMFCVLPSLETALADIQRSTGPREGPRADAAFLNEFIQAAIGTLRAQCGMDVRAGKARSGADRLDREIAGVIDLASEAFQGCIAIAYPKATFLNVIGRMLGETYPEITDDLEDGAAELLNMVFSRAKVGLNEKGFRIERAIPRTLRGKALESLHASEHPVLTIPFESDAGPFRIEIVVEAKRKAEAS